MIEVSLLVRMGRRGFQERWQLASVGERELKEPGNSQPGVRGGLHAQFREINHVRIGQRWIIPELVLPRPDRGMRR